MSDSRPNLLLFMPDQLRADSVCCFGNPVVQTPNVDALAAAGTRFANALAATGATPAEMSWKAGVDILCLGFTKNGALAAEAIIVFDPSKDWELQLRRKRGGHLFSKMRFMTAQVEAMMTGGLWLRCAAHANAMAARLASGLRGIDGVDLMHPVDANLMFARLPRAAHERAKAAGAMYYDMPPAPGEALA